jgi:signal transduction histidine kinase
MSRKILIQVSAPTVLIGLILFIACLVSAWYISRLQRDLARILSREVNSLVAAKEVEVRVRQLRFHNFLNLIDPKHANNQRIDEVHEGFEDALDRAQRSAQGPAEQACVGKIRDGYRRYKQELANMPAELRGLGKDADLHRWVESHPIRHVVDPSMDLQRITREQMEKTAVEAEQISRLVRLTMLGLGVLAPLSGLLAGYGIARGLTRSIYQLSVRVHDIAQHLDQNVASVTIPVRGDLQHVDKQLQHVVSRVEEVTRDMHRHQREMLRAEQLSAVGQLAASVAHEVRNPLTSVKLLVEAALRPRNRKPLTEEDLEVIHGEVVRLEQTVQGFLDFARPRALQRGHWDLRDLIARAVELVRARARQQGVAVEVACGDEPVRAEVDGDQLCTVLVNLFLNALDAMPQGGRLEVTLAPAADGACLSVADTGAGIPPEIAGRLFTPFVSSKPTGTGLGLSISRRVVEEHGGRITAVNRPQRGACFSITLPQTVKEPVHADAAGH